MKPHLFLLIAVSLGLNIASVSPTKAQITANPTSPSQTQKGILQAQTPDIETLQQEASKYTQQGKPQQAIETLQQVLKLAQPIGDKENEAIAYLGLGFNYTNIGKPQLALENYDKALLIVREIKYRSGEATTLNNIGAVYLSIGQPEEALKYYNQAFPIFREVGDRSGEGTTLSNMGFVYRDTNQPDKAITVWEESVNITLEIRKGLGRHKRKAFIEAKDNTAIALVDLLIKQKQYQKAYQWANLVTTFDLADYNRLIDAKVANPEAQKAIDNWNQQNQQLQFLRSQLEEEFEENLARRMRDKEAEVFKLAEDIINRFPDIAELFETTPTDIVKLQQTIAKDTLVIQPILLTNTRNVDNTIAFFLVTQNSLEVIQKDINPEEFNSLVTSYRTQLADFYNSDVYETSSQLYQLLITPIEAEIKAQSPKRLAIIATGNLRYIPFESLLNEATDEFLLQTYPIHYLTRISTGNPPSKGEDRHSASQGGTRFQSPPGLGDLGGENLGDETQETYVYTVASQKGNIGKMSALAFANPKPIQVDLIGTEIEADFLTNNFSGSKSYKQEKATLDRFKTEIAITKKMSTKSTTRRQGIGYFFPQLRKSISTAKR